MHTAVQVEEAIVTIVAAGEDVVPASELAEALKQVREIPRLLGKKTMEVEILKEAMECGLSRKWIAHTPLLPKDGKRQKDAQSADKKAADMLAKYERRKGIVVSGAPRFAGTIKITTSAVIDNRANLNYLLTHSCLDYKCNILSD